MAINYGPPPPWTGPAMGGMFQPPAQPAPAPPPSSWQPPPAKPGVPPQLSIPGGWNAQPGPGLGNVMPAGPPSSWQPPMVGKPAAPPRASLPPGWNAPPGPGLDNRMSPSNPGAWDQPAAPSNPGAWGPPMVGKSPALPSRPLYGTGQERQRPQTWQERLAAMQPRPAEGMQPFRPQMNMDWRQPFRPQMNEQQQQMANMPAAMRQMYNNRPVTKQAQPMQAPSPPTQRGRAVASRVNLQGNQLNRFRY